MDEKGVFKITDFGFAKFNTNNKLHSVLGTNNYMSPQVNINSHFYTSKADMWSLGIMLYHMLFKKYPPSNYIQAIKIAK